MKEEDIKGKRVIEVGSMDVNGSLRKIAESYKPKSYVGVDIAEGVGVDVVCKAENLTETFQPSSFDVLISTEMLEHARNWKESVSNFKNVIKADGIIILTVRSYGFPYHGFPHDFWRFEVEDIKNIFSDCSIEIMEKDPRKGVFAKIRKPKDFVENDLADYEVYSIVTGKKIKQLNTQDFQSFLKRRKVMKRLTLEFELAEPSEATVVEGNDKIVLFMQKMLEEKMK